jgi:hypothetical protein
MLRADSRQPFFSFFYTEAIQNSNICNILLSHNLAP